MHAAITGSMNAQAAPLDELTAQAIRSAITLAQAGRLSDACALAERSLSGGAEIGPIHALLGMLRCRAGNLEGGVAALRVALDQRPADPSIALNLVTALNELGRFDEALEVATPEAARSDPTGRLAHFRPWLLQQAGRFDDAVPLYRELLDRQPGDWQSWNNLGNALAASGRTNEAREALQRAVERAPQVAPLRLNLARTLIDLGELNEAEAVLREGAASFSDDEHFWIDLYELLTRRGDSEAARDALAEACRRRPLDSELRLVLARSEMDLLRLDAAEESFRAILAHDPANADAFVGLAVTFEHGQPERLEELAEKAGKAGIAGPQQRLLTAFAQARRKDFEGVVESLRQVPADIEPIHRHQLLGQALDRLGQVDKAWSAFEAMNQALAADPSRPLDRAGDYRAEVERQTGKLDSEWVASWSSPSLPPLQRTPIFLVGFPRSGTTLLDTFLMGHPDVEVMEETRGLALVDQQVGGFDSLPSLDAAALEQARALYFEEAGRHVPLAAGKLLIDKSPLFLNRVPLIRRLFPEARFLLALRHPGDVLLSCFFSNFRLNPAMSNFVKLHTAAELYHLSFAYWTKSRDIFAPEVVEVRYEQLVKDAEAELQPVIDRLGLDWKPELLDHRRTAGERGLITTASYAQVHEPIYTRSAGRWQPYRKHLEPVLPLLRPWAERFGYEMD